MSKKILSFALVSALMAMCLFPACVMADSWFCPECGTANELNFCTGCGTPRPQATAAPETGNGGGSFLGSWFPSFFQTATPEPAPTPTTAPTDEPAAAVTPASRQSFPGWVIPALDPTPSVTAAPATPLAPSQVPTEVPTPTPTDAPVPEPAPTEAPDQSEWLKDFSLIVGLGEVTVDYSGYKATHPGQYYVYTAYGVNDYYTWFTMEPEETNLRLEAVPGEKMVFGVYCDAAENGRPRFDAKQMKSVTLPAAIPYTEISFSEHSHDVILDEGGETLPKTDNQTPGGQRLGLTQLRLQLSCRFLGDLGEDEISLAGIDQGRDHKVADHRQTEDDHHFHSPVPHTVSYAGKGFGGFFFHQELHGEETAGFLENTGSQTAIDGKQECIAHDGCSVRPLQDQLVHYAFQHQGKYDECPCTYEDGGHLGMMLTRQPYRKANGNGYSQDGIYSHQDKCTSRNHDILSFDDKDRKKIYLRSKPYQPMPSSGSRDYSIDVPPALGTFAAG